MRITLKAIAVCVALGATMAVGSAGAQTLPTRQHPAHVEQQINGWYLDAMDSIYRGTPSEANLIADALLELAPSDPRSYLLKARVLRLGVSDQNFERASIKSQVNPIKNLCDQAVTAADRILERDPESLAGHLYRGWGLMFKSQMHALANEYWNAGRRAKAGKEDLEFVLEHDPDNADALLIQGTFLYFADILPGVVKVARVIVRFPGGDRDRGLEYMQAAALRKGYSRLDAHPLLGVVFFGFEGRLEDGIAQFEQVLEDYPYNVRILEPLTVITLFFPERLGTALGRTERGVEMHAGGPEPWERKIAQRLRFYLSMQQMLAGRIESARSNLEILHLEPTLDPDWLDFEVRWTLANVALLLGDHKAAVQLVEELPAKDRGRRRLRYVLDERSAATPEEVQALLQIQQALQSLYAGNLQRAAEGLDALRDVDTPFMHFYRGELEMLRGNGEEALEHFGRANHVRTRRDRWAWFRYFALVRAAEIQGSRGEYGKAAKLLDDAIDKHLNKDLIRHVTRARQRYFENGAPGNGGVNRVDSHGSGDDSRASQSP
jgi:tetratricopeptide (TPR) repeat protein